MVMQTMTVASYTHGASATPLLAETIGVALARTAARFPDHEALVVPDHGVRLSYAAFDALTDRIAAGLIGLGLKPGDRIGIWSQNNAEWVITQFATAKAGLILVTINPAYRTHEVEYALNKVACRALILAPSFKSSDYLGMMASLAPELATATPGDVHAARLPDLRIVIRLGSDKTPGMLNFDEVAEKAGADHDQMRRHLVDTLQCDDPINIQFTSGTTGRPKGATLTHHNILNNGYFVGEAIRLSEADRMCIPVPLYHCFGMVMGTLAAITHGATMVLPGEGFDPVRVLETVALEQCTSLYGVPTMMIALLNHPDFAQYDLSTLRTGIMAGSPCPIEVMRQVVDRMNLKEITIAYGMTETSPVSFQSAVDDTVERRISTVGRVHPHVEVKIVNAEGHVVPRGVTGELLTRGYSVMRGYWGDEERTREAIDPARWMHTGDLAVMDVDGYCNIVGRIKDMVIRGGENIYPREVEEFLHAHPKIRDVQVFGIPDRQYGEQLCAWIIPKSGETITDAEIAAYCSGAIAHYKVPRLIRVVETFPMTVTGKIQKFVMRQMMIEELGLTEQKTA